MKVKEISIANYRSFGSQATLKFDSNVLALVGLNGIGKTNALEAISRMKFFSDNVQNVIPKSAINKNTHAVPELRLTVEIDEEDCRVFQEELEFVPQSKTGSFVFKYDENDQTTRLFLPEFFNEILQVHDCFTELKQDLKECADVIRKKGLMANREYARLFATVDEYTRQYIPAAEELGQWTQSNFVNPYFNGPSKEKAAKTFEEFFFRLQFFYKVFASVSPQIQLFRDSAEFPDAYSANDIDSWNQSLGSNYKLALSRFLSAVGSNRQELVRAFREKNDSVRNDLQDRIQHAARRLIRDFNEHYMKGSAGIDLNVKFDGDILRFTVSHVNTPGSDLWSETSSGVRWYLSAFFELHQALKSRNAIMLIDEPAMHLHVNAQKEVLSLLYQLASGTRYLVYTTHSPYMIDPDRLGDIRAIVRDGETASIRMLTGLDGPICKKDVLAPICHAIGYDMSANLSPNANKMNVIVEGLSDCCYLSAMSKLLVPDETQRPFIIPAQGASSIPNLVSIMIGWGLSFKVVLDHDREGEKTFEMLENKFSDHVRGRICYVKDEGDRVIEHLVSDHDYKMVCGSDYNPEEIKEAKIAKARRFSSMVDSGVLDPDPETKSRFGSLFRRLGFSVGDVDQKQENC